VGRASNRQRARSKAARNTHQSEPDFRTDGRRQLRLVASWRALNEALDAHLERYVMASQVWCGGQQPVPATRPWWAQRPPGRDLVRNVHVAQAQGAPCLLTAAVPSAAVIAADPAHWQVATKALIRAVVFDGLAIDHPAVSAVTTMLAPVVDAELDSRQAVRSWLAAEHRNRLPVPGFPVLDGPLLILSQCVVAKSAGALVGSNPGSQELAVLSRALDGMIPGVAGSVVAETLPGDDPLEAVIATGVVTPGRLLDTGLAVLSALVQICQANAATIARRVA
jgi:hypothetical protein